jgi:hypothetical protein
MSSIDQDKPALQVFEIDRALQKIQKGREKEAMIGSIGSGAASITDFPFPFRSEVAATTSFMSSPSNFVLTDYRGAFVVSPVSSMVCGTIAAAAMTP